MSGQHSILPPSGAAAWRQCPMWVHMNRAFPKPETPESMEGTAAHWVFAEMLAGRQVTAGMTAPNGVIVTDEMVDGGELVVNVVEARLANEFPQLHVEQPIACARIHPECWGTPDIWAYSPVQMVLEVVDYKFGHRFVDEFENDQGVTYIAGILDQIAAESGQPVGLIDQAIMVNFTVIQPRCFYRGAPVRTWTVRACDLRAQINLLTVAANDAMSAHPAAVTNPECTDCPGRHACDALQKAAYRDAEFATVSAPVVMSSQAASLELRMLERACERLQARVDGLREMVTAYVKQGQPTPFYSLESTYGRQTWTVPVEQVIALGDLMGVDLRKPAVKTPKQAQKLGVDEAVIKGYSVTPSGSVKLIQINPADARRVFGKF